MSESCAIEVYENECYDRKRGGWAPHKEFPYFMKATQTPCKPLDEIDLPDDEWQWATNWKITKMPGVTDADGWEYASRFARFKNQKRAPKSDGMWRKARRRLWIRIMRRETTVKASDVTKVLPKIQLGLSSIHSARIKIEEIMKHAPEAADSDQMRSLVTSVNRNIADIITVLDQAEKNADSLTPTATAATAGTGIGGRGMTPTNSTAVLKKLRNDVLKEEAAIERALEYKSTSIPINNSSNNNNNLRQSNISSSLASSFRGSSLSSNSSNTSNSLLLAPRPSLTTSSSSSHSQRLHASTLTAPSPSHRSNSVELRQDLSGVNQIVSSKKSAVKSGSAGAFNPSMFATPNASAIGANGPEDGVFVDRTTHDLLIEQVRVLYCMVLLLVVSVAECLNRFVVGGLLEITVEIDSRG
jgi:hypothetical protein